MAKKKISDLFEEDRQTVPQNDFDRLLDSSRSVTTKRLTPGDRFRGEVLAVNGLEAFVSTDTPTDAIMPFAVSETQPAPKVGDFVEVVVVRAREGEILVKAANARGAMAETDSLEDAFDMEIPVDGLVLEAVKGGFRVKLQGHKAFCPISQIDWNCTNPADYVGRKYPFVITRMERGRDLVISRRKLLELERATAEGEFQRSAEVGSIFSGTVFRLEKYGAFIRLNDGIEGLIPVSKLSYSRIHHPQEVVNIGQTVEVKLLRVVEENGRLKISFSLKQGGSVMDPWASVSAEFPVGAQIEGTVEHRESFGLFVNLTAGVTGLLPVSAWRDSTEAKQFEGKRKGDKIKVRIARLDLDARKISLGLPGEEEDETWRTHASTQETALLNKGLGTMADLLKGIKGR